MHSKLCFLLISGFLFGLLEIPLPALASAKEPTEWKKADEDNGISIFERKEDSGFLAFRVEGSVNAPIRDVASTLLDAEHTPDWVANLEEDKIVHRQGPAQFLEYTHVGTPFVLKDRDFLCLVTLQLDEKNKMLTIESHSVEDASVPPTKYVRGSVVHNEFRLSPDGSAGKTKLVGEFHIDPKGTVPRWMVNLFQRDWPKKAFHAIQRRVASVKPTVPVVLESLLAPLAGF